MEYHGQMGLQTGILVAFTQLIPEHQVQVFGVLKVRVKRLPMAYTTLSCIMCVIGYQSPWIIIQFAWLVSWVYLRFYKKNRASYLLCHLLTLFPTKAMISPTKATIFTTTSSWSTCPSVRFNDTVAGSI